jgi:choline/glycine/proline betaine transport protein
LPLTIRSALYPIFGKRINGPIGHSVDIAAVIGTIFGIATRYWRGAAQLRSERAVRYSGLAGGESGPDCAVGDHRHHLGHGVDKGIRVLSS